MEKIKGYLIISAESDEIHLSLATEEDYNKALDVIDKTPKGENINWDKVNSSFYEFDERGDVVKNNFIGKIFTQTGCIEPWIFKDYEILGIFHTINC